MRSVIEHKPVDSLSTPCDHEREMPRRSRKKPPRDRNELAASIMAEATSEATAEPIGLDSEPHETSGGKNPHAVALGRLGGKKGGRARAARLTAVQRSEIARKAALARWRNR